jgi:hypothetical protein
MLCFNTSPPPSLGQEEDGGMADGLDGRKSKRNISGMTADLEKPSCNAYGQKRKILQLQPRDDEFSLAWSKGTQVRGEDLQLSEWKPIAIDIVFCYLSSCSEGDAAASVGIKFGITCQNDSTNEGWYVTSPHMSLADFQAYAESIGLDLSETDSSCASILVSEAFRLYDVHAASSNHKANQNIKFTQSCFYVEVMKKETEGDYDFHSSPFQFRINLFHASLNTRCILFSWSTPAYNCDPSSHIGKNYMGRVVLSLSGRQQCGSILGDKGGHSQLQERLRQWNDRYQISKQESAKKNPSHVQISIPGFKDREATETTFEAVISCPTLDCTERHFKTKDLENDLVHRNGRDFNYKDGTRDHTLLEPSAALIIVEAPSKKNRKRVGHNSNSQYVRGLKRI